MIEKELEFLKKKYKDIISKEEFIVILKKVATDFSSKDSDFLAYFELNLNKYINKLLTDDNKVLLIINNYIINNFVNNSNFNICINNIKKLINFIELYDIYIDDSMIQKLIINNNILQDNLKYIIYNTNEKNKYLLNNENVLEYINAYINIYQIHINNDYFKVKNNNSNNTIYDDNEQRKLIARAQNGDKKAKEELIILNDKLVYYIVNKNLYKIKSGKLSKEDLLQEGRLGILKAIEKFDLSKEFHFSTYAVYWIKQYVSRCIVNQGRTIKISNERYSMLNELYFVEERFAIQNGYFPNAAELAKVMNITVEKVNEILKYKNDTVSLENFINSYNDEENNFLDLIEDRKQDFLGYVYLKMNLEEFNNVLDESNISLRDKSIVKLYFGLIDGDKKTLESIGEKYNLTREGVRIIIQRCLRDLGYDKNLNKVKNRIKIR